MDPSVGLNTVRIRNHFRFTSASTRKRLNEGIKWVTTNTHKRGEREEGRGNRSRD